MTNHSLSSGRHDSNVRPLGPKPSILPTVLRPECFRKSECKDSASRTIFQIYLRKSEAQPILRLRKQAKVVQAERISKSQRENIKKNFIFFSIERGRDSIIVKLFEKLPFPYGRRPKGSEAKPIFRLRSWLKLCKSRTDSHF